MKKAKTALQKFITTHVLKWLSKRRKKKAKEIASFLKSQVLQPELLVYSSKIQKNILILQRTARLFLIRRKLTLAFNCKQWLNVEIDVIRQQKKDLAIQMEQHINFMQIVNKEESIKAMASLSQTPAKLKRLLISQFMKVRTINSLFQIDY